MHRLKGRHKPHKNDMKRDFKRVGLHLSGAYFYRASRLSLYERKYVWRYEQGFYIRGMNIQFENPASDDRA